MLILGASPSLSFSLDLTSVNRPPINLLPLVCEQFPVVILTHTSVLMSRSYQISQHHVMAKSWDMKVFQVRGPALKEKPFKM